MKKQNFQNIIDDLLCSLAMQWPRTKRIFRRFLVAYLFLIICLGLTMFLLCTLELNKTADKFELSTSVLTYKELLSAWCFIIWYVIVTLIPLGEVWIIAGSYSWFFILFIVRSFAELFFPVNHHWQCQSSRYSRALYRGIYRRIMVVFYIILGFGFVYLIITIPAKDSWEKLIQLTIRLMIVSVTILLIAMWTFCLIVRQKRRRTLRFDYYLFSKQTIKNSWKFILSFIIVLAIVGNVLIPTFLICFSYIFSWGYTLCLESVDYEQKYETLIQEGYNREIKPVILKLPTPKKVKDLDRGFLNSFFGPQPKRLIKQFQQGMFLIVTVISLFVVVVPACSNVIIYRKGRDALKMIIWSTVKSMIIVGCFSLLVENAYFVDTSKILGKFTLLVFFVCISLSQTVTDPLRTSRN